MGKLSEEPTCLTGFWKPEVSGCPVCGPHGPCTVDPEGLAEMQALERRGKRERNFTFSLAIIVIIVGICFSAWLDSRS